jgi:ATP-binding cassette subfamily B protein
MKSKWQSFLSEMGLVARRSWQVWRLVPRRFKWGLGGAVFVMAITSGSSTALALLLGRLVDVVGADLKNDLPRSLVLRSATLYLALIAMAYLVRESLNVFRRYLVENTCTRIDRDMTVRVVGHLMQVDLVSITQEKLGALNGRIARSVAGFVRFLRVGFLDFLPAVLTGIFALSATLGKQPILALAMLGVIPVSLLLTVAQLLSQKGVRLELLRSREAMDGTVVEQLGGLDYVRVANTHEHETRRVADVAEQRRVKELRHHFVMSLFGCAKALNEALFHIVVISLAIYLTIIGTIQIGDILVFSMLFLNVMQPLSEVHRVIDEGHESSLQVGDLLEMLEQPIDRSFTPAEIKAPHLELDRAVIAAHNLEVEYTTPAGQRRRALRAVSMMVRHGETVGVAGRSGSGKTSWLRVLMRLAHPCGGQVWLGGVPIESITREAIGSLVGYVSQTPFVFAGTVAENIAYGCDGTSMEAIQRAAQCACIHEEILALPGGYQALITERGSNLSGGQKQRIALARVFLKNPPLLIFDEGTSALDNISERKIQRALLAAREDRTVVLVAHRLTTLRDADRILVFDDGRIVEEGVYSDLVERGGVFTELVRSAEQGVLSEAGSSRDGAATRRRAARRKMASGQPALL